MPLGRILKQVREQRHFEVDEVASYTHISPNRLADFEADEREPSFLQLERLANAYGLPPYVLVSRSLPNLPESLVDFRRPNPEPARLTPAGMHRIWASEKIAGFTRQVATILHHAPPDWTKQLRFEKPSSEAANSLRKFFDNWHERRRDRLAFTGSRDQQFLGAFRLFLEVQGLIVNINDAPSNDFLGFYVNPEGGQSLAFINRSISSKKAQLFTTVHEYAHHLLHAAGVSNPFVVRNSTERECNRFTAEFLAPMRSFRELVEKQTRSIYRDPFTLIRIVSRQSLLSNHATAIRLVEGGYLSQPDLSTWERATANNRISEKDEESAEAGEGFGQPHAKRISELGYLPTYLAKSAIDAKLIDKLDVQAGMSLSESLQPKSFSLAERRFRVAVEK
jgi:Zn-dependent peptidase ImmA (M78 family)/transcriptional regulator with XRE-family HTH domain